MGREKELKEDSETRKTQAEAGWEGERASVLPVWWAVIATQTGQDWRLVLTSCSQTLFRTHRGWIRQSGTDKVMCEEGSRSISYTFITESERNQGSWQSRERHPAAIKPLFKCYILKLRMAIISSSYHTIYSQDLLYKEQRWKYRAIWVQRFYWQMSPNEEDWKKEQGYRLKTDTKWFRKCWQILIFLLVLGVKGLEYHYSISALWWRALSYLVCSGRGLMSRGHCNVPIEGGWMFCSRFMGLSSQNRQNAWSKTDKCYFVNAYTDTHWWPFSKWTV